MPDSNVPAAARWDGVTITYPYEKRAAVGPASLHIGQGERVLLLGASGSGKSTLLNALTGLVPHAMPATVEGSIRLFGEAVGTHMPAGWAGTVGRLFQNPEETLCGMTVADEIAFALENRALPLDEIARRVDAGLAAAGLPQSMLPTRTSRLSGGERQLVALAALLAQQAPLLVIDEPTAHLAPAAAARLRAAMLDGSGGRSVVVIDHRLDDLPLHIDRVVFLDAAGAVKGGEPPRAFFRRHAEELVSLAIALPPAIGLDRALQAGGIELPQAPLTMVEATAALDHLEQPRRKAAANIVGQFVRDAAPAPSPATGTPLVTLTKADCAPLFGPVVLRDVSLSIRASETVAILGPNGAGKSTLGAALAGLLRLKAGRREGAPGAISFQNPENQFLAASVEEEIRGAIGDAADASWRDVLAAWRLGDVARRHPFELSHGQKRRLSLATITAPRRFPLLVLDEPTAGLDAAAMAELADTIATLSAGGHAVVVITHDVDFAARCCARTLVVNGGGIAADGPTEQLLADRQVIAAAGLAEPSTAILAHWLEEAGSC